MNVDGGPGPGARRPPASLAPPVCAVPARPDWMVVWVHGDNDDRGEDSEEEEEDEGYGLVGRRAVPVGDPPVRTRGPRRYPDISPDPPATRDPMMSVRGNCFGPLSEALNTQTVCRISL